jgi:mRNA interferase RelE/StbE
MALYKILLMPSIDKDLRRIPKTEQIKIFKRIEALAVNPRPPGYEKLTDQNKYRIRQGDYRIIYTVKDEELIVWVVKIGHRKDIYRVSEDKTKYAANHPKKRSL